MTTHRVTDNVNCGAARRRTPLTDGGRRCRGVRSGAARSKSLARAFIARAECNATLEVYVRMSIATCASTRVQTSYSVFDHTRALAHGFVHGVQVSEPRASSSIIRRRVFFDGPRGSHSSPYTQLRGHRPLAVYALCGRSSRRCMADRTNPIDRRPHWISNR